MKTELISYTSSVKGETIQGELFLPEGEPIALLQFAHGMSDYGARYLPLFTELVNHGYIVAYGDHLGHGKTAAASEDLGYFASQEGYKRVVEDFNTLYDDLSRQFPTLPHYVMGHSMGSFIVRCFLATGKSDGAILMGTGNKNPLVNFGILLSKAIGKVRGERYRSEFIAKMAFGSYNKRITDSNHQWAWLSHDAAAQQNILEDPLRNQLFTASAFGDLFHLVKYANSDECLAKTPKDLPMLFISGDGDPLGPYGEGIEKLTKTMRAKGFRGIDVHIIKNARHELCHEVQKQAVFADIIQWLATVEERTK